jgi:hypothetical protein
MRRPTPPRERRGGTCPPARPGGSFFRYVEIKNPHDASRCESDIPRVSAFCRRLPPAACRLPPAALVLTPVDCDTHTPSPQHATSDRAS